MISLSTKDNFSSEKVEEEQNTERSGIDLICVFDTSSSMSGSKIELVKKTLSYILTILKENDRLSLVEFNSYSKRLCPLLRATNENL